MRGRPPVYEEPRISPLGDACDGARMKHRTRYLIGSAVGALVIHIALVACSDSSGGSGATAASDAGGILDALVDVMTGIIDSKDAKADTPSVGMFAQTEVFEEPCLQTFTVQDGPTTLTEYMAVHTFPGVSANDLAHRLFVTYRRATVKDTAPPGYAIHLEEDGIDFLVKDGEATIVCGSDSKKGDFGIFHFHK